MLKRLCIATPALLLFAVSTVRAVDDGTWSLAIPSSPGGRIAPAWVHDPVRNRLVLTGNADPYQTSYDPSTYVLPFGGATEWARLGTTGNPPAVGGSQVTVFDQARDRMLILNIGANVHALTFTVPMNGPPAWSSFTPSGAYPGPRQGVVGIYDVANDRVVLFGGYQGGTAMNDVWVLSLSNPPTWTQLTPAGTPPPARWLGAAIYDAPRQRMIIFGGGDTGSNLLNDVWALSLNGTPTWTQITPSGTPPSPRFLTVACYDAARQRMVIFGGSGPLSDTWALSLAGAPAWTELATATHPPGRENAMLGFDSAQDRLVLYGGPYRTDAWQLPLSPMTDWSQMVVDPWPAAPKTDPHLVYDPVRHRLLQIGVTDLWAYALTGPPTWTHDVLAGPAPPSSLFWFSTVYDPNGDRVLIFGGQSSPAGTNDTWALKLSGTPAWEKLTPDGPLPEPRWNHAAFYDPLRRRMVVFGGTSQAFGSMIDTWALSLSGPLQWTEIPATGSYPPQDYAFSVFYDAPADRMIAWAGIGQKLWSLTLSGTPTWSQLVPAGTPASRGGAATIMDPVRRRLVVFGGVSTGVTNDTWALRLAPPIGWSQLSPAGTPPDRREGVKGVYDPVADRMVIRGGVLYHTLPGYPDIYYNDVGFLTWGQPLNDVPDPMRSGGLIWVRPNPADDEQVLGIDRVDGATAARLDIYSAAGRRVWSRELAPQGPGVQKVRWDGRTDRGSRVPPGIYFARVRSAAGETTRRIVRIR